MICSSSLTSVPIPLAIGAAIFFQVAELRSVARPISNPPRSLAPLPKKYPIPCSIPRAVDIDCACSTACLIGLSTMNLMNAAFFIHSTGVNLLAAATDSSAILLLRVLLPSPAMISAPLTTALRLVVARNASSIPAINLI